MVAIQSVAQVFTHKNYLVRRKILKLFGASFHIFDPQGNVVMFSSQKAFKLKEDIRVFTGEDMQTEVLTILARRIIDIAATYDVYDPMQAGMKVGALKRKGLRSVLRDEWIIMDERDNEIGLIQEDSMLLAMVRRLLTNLVPQRFAGFIRGTEVCTFRQNFNPFVMKIELDFSMDRGNLLDRRLGIAAAVLLCAIEGRQN